MAAAGKDQETDASGLLNCFKNLGYSMGTALIGVLLLLSVFGGLTAGIESTGLVDNTTKDEIHDGLFNYMEKKCKLALPKYPHNWFPTLPGSLIQPSVPP